MGLCQSNQGPRDKATGNLLNMSKAYPLFIFSSCSVGVGAEGEARVVVTQRPGQRLDIHAVLERQCREGVTQIVETDMLGSNGFQYLVMGVAEGIQMFFGN